MNKIFNWDDYTEAKHKQITSDYVWFAINCTGTGYLYKTRPILRSDNHWYGNAEVTLFVGVFDNKNYEQSVIKRPSVFNWLDKKGDVLATEYKWFAINSKGWGFVFKTKPVWDESRAYWFQTDKNNEPHVGVFVGDFFVKDNKSSLKKRPTIKEKPFVFSWVNHNKKVVAKKFNYFAIDEDGEGCVFIGLPTLGYSMSSIIMNVWLGNNKTFVGNFDRSTVDWHKSMQQRSIVENLPVLPNKVLKHKYDISQIQDFHASLDYELAFNIYIKNKFVL